MTKSYKLFLIIFLMSMPLASTAQQDVERHYRVELIVVRHLSGNSDSAPQEELRDLTDVLDLYAPADETEGTNPEESPLEQPQSGIDLHAESTDKMTAGELYEAAVAEPVAVRIDDMSDTMREAWRRLRLSAGFRPELFRAWEQSGDGPFPQLRIHDDEVLFEIVPAPLLSEVPVDEYGALVFSDATVQREPESGLLPETGESPELPPVRYFYRIDGTATLTRSRFLHLDLDIELREPLYESGPEPSRNGLSGTGFPVTETDGGIVTEEEFGSDGLMEPVTDLKRGPAAEASSFRIYRIAQRRQIRTEQMEYFDGPVIGVLAYIIGFDVVAESPQPEFEPAPSEPQSGPDSEPDSESVPGPAF